jgi:murein DD-endopeptidase MepM/ murein hydrolase activator NlpD
MGYICKRAHSIRTAMISMRRRKDGRREVMIGATLLALLLGGSCRPDFPGGGRDDARNGTAAAAEIPAQPQEPATVRWVPGQVVEGTLFSIIVEAGVPAVRSAVGTFAGERLHFHRDGAALIALAAAPLDSTGPRGLGLELVHADGSVDVRQLDVIVAAGEYRMETLSVAPQFGRPQPPAIQARIAEEGARARAVSTASHGTPRLWEAPFVAPRESRITSGFGHGRSFNGQVQSRHTGVDFAGAVGAPIRAPARAVVALVDDFYLGGGVIYLDHGAGLVTGYLHLSGKDVAAGDTVAAGQVIGRVGATGRVTGPHLHWIVRYGGHTVDGTSLLSLPAP